MHHISLQGFCLGELYASPHNRFWETFHVALGINSGGVFNTQQTGLRFLSWIFLAGSYSTRFKLWYDFIYISTVHITHLILYSIRILIILSDMVNSIFPLFIHRGLNIVHHLRLFFRVSSSSSYWLLIKCGRIRIWTLQSISIYLILSHYLEETGHRSSRCGYIQCAAKYIGVCFF